MQARGGRGLLKLELQWLLAPKCVPGTESRSSGGAAAAVPESPAQMEVIYNLLQLSVLHARIHVAVLLNL